jgi:hypothetical protein
MSNEHESKIFLSRIGPDLSKSFDHALQPVFTHMHSVIGSDRLMKALEAIHPGFTVFFGDKENSPDQFPIYKELGISPVDIKKAIKDTGIVSSSWAHANKPLYGY